MIFTKKYQKLCLLRYDKIKKNPFTWILFLISLILSFILTAFFDEGNESSCVKAINEILKNFSYSYIAGFIFYLLSDFLPNTAKEHLAKLIILGHLDYIISPLDFFEKEVSFGNQKECSKDPSLLAAFMVIEPVANVHFESELDSKTVTVKPEVKTMMDIYKKRLKDYTSLLLANSNQWIDEFRWSQIYTIESFFAPYQFIANGNIYRVDTLILYDLCKNYYEAKYCLQKYKEELLRYNFL